MPSIEKQTNMHQHRWVSKTKYRPSKECYYKRVCFHLHNILNVQNDTIYLGTGICDKIIRETRQVINTKVKVVATSRGEDGGNLRLEGYVGDFNVLFLH